MFSIIYSYVYNKCYWNLISIYASIWQAFTLWMKCLCINEALFLICINSIVYVKKSRMDVTIQRDNSTWLFNVTIQCVL